MAPPGPSWPRVDASERALAWPLRGVEVEDEGREYDGEWCDWGADVGGGGAACPPWAFLFLGELV